MDDSGYIAEADLPQSDLGGLNTHPTSTPLKEANGKVNKPAHGTPSSLKSRSMQSLSGKRMFLYCH